MNEAKGTESRNSTVRSYFIHALTPLHVGVGEGVGAINLPTAREQATGYPYLPGSSAKGVLRDLSERRLGMDVQQTLVAFGPRTENAADARGGLVISDATLLALPVRSLYGTFAWATCPFVARRLARDLQEAGINIPDGLPEVARGLSKQAWITTKSALGGGDRALLLLDYALEKGKFEQGGKLDTLAAWLGGQLWAGDKDAQAFFAARLMVLQDDLFGFLTRTALEVRSRVKIDDERGTAGDSGSWLEEHMPAETLLHGLAFGRETAWVQKSDNGANPRKERKGAAESLAVLAGLLGGGPTLRFGGKSSTGLGRARIVLVGGGA